MCISLTLRHENDLKNRPRLTVLHTRERKCNNHPDYLKMSKLAKTKGVTEQKESTEENQLYAHFESGC